MRSPPRLSPSCQQVRQVEQGNRGSACQRDGAVCSRLRVLRSPQPDAGARNHKGGRCVQLLGPLGRMRSRRRHAGQHLPVHPRCTPGLGWEEVLGRTETSGQQAVLRLLPLPHPPACLPAVATEMADVLSMDPQVGAAAGKAGTAGPCDAREDEGGEEPRRLDRWQAGCVSFGSRLSSESPLTHPPPSLPPPLPSTTQRNWLRC